MWALFSNLLKKVKKYIQMTSPIWIFVTLSLSSPDKHLFLRPDVRHRFECPDKFFRPWRGTSDQAQCSGKYLPSAEASPDTGARKALCHLEHKQTKHGLIVHAIISFWWPYKHNLEIRWQWRNRLKQIICISWSILNGIEKKSGEKM